jgi:hypothetical protein
VRTTCRQPEPSQTQSAREQRNCCKARNSVHGCEISFVSLVGALA